MTMRNCGGPAEELHETEIEAAQSHTHCLHAHEISTHRLAFSSHRTQPFIPRGNAMSRQMLAPTLI